MQTHESSLNATPKVNAELDPDLFSRCLVAPSDVPDILGTIHNLFNMNNRLKQTLCQLRTPPDTDQIRQMRVA